MRRESLWSDAASAPPPRREVRPLPAQILDHSTVCLEEGLWSQGFALQSRCLEAGNENAVPARVPPPSHLGFASTLTVHPFMTTRTRKKDRKAASSAALKHLRQTINTINATDGGFKDAFRFKSSRAQSERSKRASTRRSDAAEGSDDETPKSGFLRSEWYSKKALWIHAEDFWAIVGWAFNCSVLHKGRWEKWKTWLEMMLDMLQDDLNEHIRLKEGKDVGMGDCLLAQYISTVGDGRNNRRRIMRAITADGTKKMAAEFIEIWKNEAKPPPKKKDQPLSKRRKLDLDNDQFGDYGESDSEEEEASDGKKRKTGSLSAQSTRSRRSKDAAHEVKVEFDSMDDDDAEMDGHVATLNGVEGFGGMDSIRLRQRLLALLTRFSQVAPELFMDTEELFSLFTEFIRPLPLSIFQQFVLPLKPWLSINLQASLLEMLCQPFLGTGNTTGFVTQQMFETSFAPHAANTTTAADNAKLSLLIESLLRALWNSGSLTGDLASLKAKIEKGIKAREEKVAYDGRKKVGKTQMLDEQAKTSLRCSGERMMILLDVMTS